MTSSPTASWQQLKQLDLRTCCEFVELHLGLRSAVGRAKLTCSDVGDELTVVRSRTGVLLMNEGGKLELNWLANWQPVLLTQNVGDVETSCFAVYEPCGNVRHRLETPHLATCDACKQ